MASAPVAWLVAIDGVRIPAPGDPGAAIGADLDRAFALRAVAAALRRAARLSIAHSDFGRVAPGHDHLAWAVADQASQRQRLAECR